MRMQVAGEVLAWMARRRMSAPRLAGVLGVSPTYVYRRLNGETALDVDDLDRMARALDVPVSTFFMRPDGSPTAPYPSPLDGRFRHVRGPFLSQRGCCVTKMNRQRSRARTSPHTRGVIVDFIDRSVTEHVVWMRLRRLSDATVDLRLVALRSLSRSAGKPPLLCTAADLDAWQRGLTVADSSRASYVSQVAASTPGRSSTPCSARTRPPSLFPRTSPAASRARSPRTTWSWPSPPRPNGSRRGWSSPRTPGSGPPRSRT